MAKKNAATVSLDASMRIVVLHGPERFYHLDLTRQLIAALAAEHGDPEQFTFDGNRAELADVLDELRSYGLMQTHKVVIVEHADKFLAGGEGRRRKMEDYAKNPVESATLLMRAETWRPGNFDKIVDKVGVVVKCDAPSSRDAAGWCTKNAKRLHGCTIEREAVGLLVERSGTSLARLDTELEKLATFIGQGASITIDDVRVMIEPSREERAWEIQTAIMTGHSGTALAKLRELQDVSRVEEVIIMWAIADLIRKLHAGAQLTRQGAPGSAIASQLRLFGPARNPILDAVRRVDPSAFAQLLRDALNTDRKIKTGLANGSRSLEGLTVLVTDTIALN